MTTEELIIQLIQHDMKHQQLVEYICKAGFETELHGPDFYNLVATLMGIPPEQDPPYRWSEIYLDCMANTIHSH